MSVIINILIFLAIFGYALYTLVKFSSVQNKENVVHVTLIVIVVEQNSTQRIIFQEIIKKMSTGKGDLMLIFDARYVKVSLFTFYD